MGALHELGIDVEVRPLEFATFFADVKAGNMQLYLMQSGEIVEPEALAHFFHSLRIPTHDEPELAAQVIRAVAADVPEPKPKKPKPAKAKVK